MSQLIFEFDPSLATTGQIPIGQPATAQGSFHFWNESNIGLLITFQDGIALWLEHWGTVRVLNQFIDLGNLPGML